MFFILRFASLKCTAPQNQKKKNSTQTVKYSTSHLLLQCIWHGLNRLYRVFNCSNRNILIPLRPSNVWRRYFVTIYTRLALIQSHATHILSQLMFDSCSALNPCIAYHSFHSIPHFDSLIYVSGDIFFSLFSFLLFVVLCLGIMNNAASFGCVCVCVCDIADSVNWYASANKETWLSTNRRKNWHTVRIVVAYLIQWLRYIYAFICPRLSVHSLSLSLPPPPINVLLIFSSSFALHNNTLRRWNGICVFVFWNTCNTKPFSKCVHHLDCITYFMGAKLVLAQPLSRWAHIHTHHSPSHATFYLLKLQCKQQHAN